MCASSTEHNAGAVILKENYWVCTSCDQEWRGVFPLLIVGSGT